MDRDSVANALNRIVGGLRIWGVDHSLPSILTSSELEVARLVRQTQDPGALLPAMRGWQDAVGWQIRWWSTYAVALHDPEHRSTQPSSSRMAEWLYEAISLSLDWSRIIDALEGTYLGIYEFSQLGRRDVQFAFIGDPRLEAEAQREGIRAAGVTPNLALVGPEMLSLAAWARGGGRDPFEMPHPLLRSLVRSGRQMATQQTEELNPDTSFGGFTLAVARKLWAVLFTYARAAFASMFFLDNAGPAVLASEATALVARLAKLSGVSPSEAEAFVEFMTYRHGYHPDPAIAPLVPFRNFVLIPATLVLMSAFERNLLRAAALDPNAYGRIASERGRAGAVDIERLLGSHAGTITARGIKVFDEGGQVVGDLDVVAADPNEGLGVAVEVKWPSPPDSLKEVSKAEDEIRKGQAQLLRLKRALASARGRAALPRGWPAFADLEWRWLVVCRGHQPCTPALITHEIPVVSRDRVWYSLEASLGNSLRALLDGVGLPVEGRDFDRKWSDVRFGGWRARVEGIVLHAW